MSTVINYADRVNIAVAGADIMRQTGWNKEQFGIILSAFLLGYALFQFPGGRIADRWSPRKMLALSCAGFSLFTALTPLGQYGLWPMLACDFLSVFVSPSVYPPLPLSTRNGSHAKSMLVHRQ